MERGISMMWSEVLNNVQLFNTWLSLMAEPENLKEWVRQENESCLKWISLMEEDILKNV